MIKAAFRRWGPRVPFLAVAAGCLVGIAAAEAGATVAAGWVLVPVAAVAAVLAWRSQAVAAMALFAAAGFWFLHGERLRDLEAVAEWLGESRSREVRLEGVVERRQDGGMMRPEAVVRVTGGEAGIPAGPRLALWGIPPEARPGDHLRLAVRLERPPPARNPGELDRREALRRNGWAAEGRIFRAEVAGPPAARHLLRRWSWWARGEVRERILRGLPAGSRRAALIEGLVLGERSAMTGEDTAAFRRSGTMHVFAVSGLHVGLVGAIGWWLLRLGRVPRSAGLWFVLALMWSYAFVTGLRPPAMRAALMATVFLAGFAAKRKPAMANSLLASLPLVLAADSFQWRQAGFQLSYLVVGSILLFAPLLYQRVLRWVDGDPFLPRLLYTSRQERWLSLRQNIAGLVTVSLAAWMGSLPLMALHFGIVTPSAVLASVILIPVVTVVLTIALLGLVVGLVWGPAESAANVVNGVLAEGAYLVAHGCARVPGAYVLLDRAGEWKEGAVVYDLRGGNGAVFCDAGSGVLLDAGGDREFWRVVMPSLRRAGRRAGSLVVSHADSGHCGGVPGALRVWSPRQLLVPEETARSAAYREMLERAGEEGCRVLRAGRGRRYRLGEGVDLEVVEVPAGNEALVADDRCAVMRMHWDGWRILLTGDAGLVTERRLLERGAEVASEVWVMGRHDSDFTGTLEFVRAVKPRVIVATEAWYPESERIPAWWCEMIAAEGITLLRQSDTGGVMLLPRADRLEVRPYLQRERTVVLER